MFFANCSAFADRGFLLKILVCEAEIIPVLPQMSQVFMCFLGGVISYPNPYSKEEGVVQCTNCKNIARVLQV